MQVRKIKAGRKKKDIYNQLSDKSSRNSFLLFIVKRLTSYHKTWIGPSEYYFIELAELRYPRSDLCGDTFNNLIAERVARTSL